jgi:P4 family phage/plasmid primase-like protien
MTSMGKELPGKWLIPDEDYPQFLDLYHDYLFVKKNRSLNLVEQPRVNSPKPFLIDLDFRYSVGQALQRSFTMEQVHSFCKMLVSSLEHFFDLEQHLMLRFFVTLRPSPYNSAGTHKDGVHIMCPDISLSNEKQKVLRKWLLEQKAVTKCFEGSNYTNKDEDVYDESMTRKQGWIFYGESKPAIPPYELSSVLRYDPAKETFLAEDTKKYTPRQLMQVLSVRYDLADDENVVREEASVEYQAILDPPVSYQKAEVLVSPADDGNTMEKETLEAIRDMLAPSGYSTSEKDIIRNLVINCLSEERAEKYETWIRVGWCLHNIEASEDMFQLWMDFSKKSSKSCGNNIAELRRSWFTGMRKEGDGPRLTEMSLRKWARDDNPTAYKEITESDIIEYILKELRPTHFHIVQVMEKIYKSTYKASITQRTTDWYFYDDVINFWKPLNQGIQLRRKISYEVAEFVGIAREKKKKQLANQGKDILDIGKDPEFMKLFKIEESLYNAGFIDALMKMAATAFYEEDFHNKLNSNTTLFGCKNGVIELRAQTKENPNEHVIFRQGRPEDFVSFRGGNNPPKSEAIEYTPFNDLNKEQFTQLQFLKDFFKQIYPDEQLRTYVLRLLASCLEGANREQCYYTMIGEGSNGKSMLMNLCAITFGDYQTTLATTAITRKRPESSAANPDIIDIKNKRIISMNEPDSNEPINTSRMKQFSGEDLVEARGLYKDQEKFTVTGKLFMLTNKLPPINTMDYGTWRRIRAIPHVAAFYLADDPRLGGPNTYLKDPEFVNKLNPCREVFLSWLVHIYDTEYLVHGLDPVPEAVKRETAQYREDFDSFAKFRNERIKKTAGSQTTFKQIANAYREWLQDGNKGANRLTPRELEKRVNNEFGTPADGKTYNHIELFSEEEIL